MRAKLPLKQNPHGAPRWRLGQNAVTILVDNVARSRNQGTRNMAAKTNGNGETGAALGGKPVVLTKMDAVRQAMSKLGFDAGRAAIRDFVKARFGIEMTADHISTCKADILRRRKVGPKSVGPAARPAKSAVGTANAVNGPVHKSTAAKPVTAAAQSKNYPATARVPEHEAKNGSAKTGAGISLKDILAVKDLVGRVGASQLKTLIDAFNG